MSDVLTREQYMARKGAPRMGGADSALHRTPGGFPKGVRKFHLERVQKAMQANREKREILSFEYDLLILSGEIRPPTRIESLERVAGGDPLMESTQAARRLLKKLENLKGS